jgi:hypothetical protein
MAGRDKREGQGHCSKLEDTGCHSSLHTQPAGQDAAHLAQVLSPLRGIACPGNGLMAEVKLHLQQLITVTHLNSGLVNIYTIPSMFNGA